MARHFRDFWTECSSKINKGFGTLQTLLFMLFLGLYWEFITTLLVLVFLENSTQFLSGFLWKIGKWCGNSNIKIKFPNQKTPYFPTCKLSFRNCFTSTSTSLFFFSFLISLKILIFPIRSCISIFLFSKAYSTEYIYLMS